MTVATGNAALAADVVAIRTLATSASTAASVAAANAATALSSAVAAQATATEAQAAASVALSVSSLPLVTTVAGSSTVPIGQGGTTVAATLSTLLNAETIDLLGAATAAADTDTFMVGQGSNILVRQTMAAVWTYLQGKIPGYKIPVQEITASKTLDATYNGQVLVVTGAGVTLTPNYLLMGPGFECEIVTSGSGTVIWGAGITATNGGTGLSSANAYAKLIAFSSSAGNVVLACVGAAPGAAPGGVSSGGSVAAPGPVTALTLCSVTSSSLAFSWMAPTTGGAATYYQVQYRVYGSGGAWTPLGTNPTMTSATITGLSASRQYDVEVAANNTGGVASSYVVYGQSPVATTAGTASYTVSLTWAPSNNGTSILPPTTPVSHAGAWPIGGLNFTASTALTGTQTPWIVYSTSGTIAPQPTQTAGPVSWQAAADGAPNGYGAYCTPPASAGTWYVWAIATATSSSISTIIGAQASQPITVT